MHRIHYTIRRIAPDQLPTVEDIASGGRRAATEAELANAGLVRLAGDIFSCVEQLQRDNDTLEWSAVGHQPVGELLAHGEKRFDQLPDDVRERVMLAEVITAVDPAAPSAVAQATAIVAEQEAAIAEFVGPVAGAPLVELSIDDEARRLAAMPDTGIERLLVPMADANAETQVIERTDVRPHGWAGERF